MTNGLSPKHICACSAYMDPDSNNLKGIDRFYVGQDLVTWYESRGVDIFKELSSEELINKVGLTAVQNLLKKVLNLFHILI